VSDPPEATAATVEEAVAWLEAHGSEKTLAEMGTKYGIGADAAFGVPMAQMKQLARTLGHDHDLAAALWRSGSYEARMVAAMVDVADEVTPVQMDAWASDFDSWAICDTVCFTLFDRAPDAWTKVDQWSTSSSEYVKRAAFALLWSLALHDKQADEDRFVHGLDLVEREADDARPQIQKALLMSLRATARRSGSLGSAVHDLGARMAAAERGPRRTLGNRALRL